MTAYVLAHLRFTDEPRYRRYQTRFPEVFAGSGGTALVADEEPVVLSGDVAVDKVVVMSFDDVEAAEAFLRSPEYQEISHDREAGADTVSFLVRGLDAAGR